MQPRFLFITATLVGFLAIAPLGALLDSCCAADVSSPAMLQVFEARWDTIEDRMADIHATGYGRLWLPPPARADSGGLSVGYDVFDRFDLGKPRNETLYGTETGLKTLIGQAHRAGVRVNTDFIPNHNGFSDASTFDNQGTPSDPTDDVTFLGSGGYPGFVVRLPNDIDGDFHGAFEGGEQNFRLSGLIDIAQEKNHEFIRHPTAFGNPLNIPAGTEGIFGRPAQNVPNPGNAAFYPDQGLGGTAVFDARTGQNVTLYDFNTTNPLAGDPYAENATGLLMRNIRWMIQEVGVDGFRFDAGRHFPRWVMNYLDQAAFLAEREPLLDGSPQHPYSFTEVGYDSFAFQQDFIRKDINNANLTQVGGNRDALDFNLFGALKANLTSNGLANNWHGIRNASIDINDDGLRNGSQGVAFAQSHDELGPFLQNVAYAYILMRPGEAIVYTNAKEFGEGRDFPRGGKDDALGGVYGDTITTLVELRNSHGRGDFRERWIDDAFNPNGFSNVYVYERSKSAVVGLNSRNDGGIETRTVQTDFAPGTVLVELTGNATDSAVDPAGLIADSVRVDAQGRIPVSIPGNNPTGRGYVIYGVAGPQGTLTLPGSTATLPGATPTAARNGVDRLAGIDVVTTSSFQVRLATNPVSLPAPAGDAVPFRDIHADGDTAMLKIDGGLDLNGNGVVDDVAPGSVGYGFENFTGTRTPGYIAAPGGGNIGTGAGLYEQTIDASALGEGRHYITARAFRHRDSATGGDGGPAVFTDFKKTIYVDLLPPESEVVSFAPFASDPTNPNNRDLIVRSVDKTAESVHVFFDLPATMSETSIIAMAQQPSGNGAAGYYDRDQWITGRFGVTSGNHVATVVTFELTGNVNVQRFAGLYTDTNLGAGFGDLDSDGVYETSDLRSLSGFERLLQRQNLNFNAAADPTGDGLIDNRDLFALESHLLAGGASAAVLAEYEGVLLRRGDLDANGVTNGADLAALYANLGSTAWLYDLNTNGVADLDDARVLVTQLARTMPGDFNLDGLVDAADYTVWRDGLGNDHAADGDFDGDIDSADRDVWVAAFGSARTPLGAGLAIGAPVPEPTAAVLLFISLAASVSAARKPRKVETTERTRSRGAHNRRPPFVSLED